MDSSFIIDAGMVSEDISDCGPQQTIGSFCWIILARTCFINRNTVKPVWNNYLPVCPVWMVVKRKVLFLEYVYNVGAHKLLAWMYTNLYHNVYCFSVSFTWRLLTSVSLSVWLYSCYFQKAYITVCSFVDRLCQNSKIRIALFDSVIRSQKSTSFS